MWLAQAEGDEARKDAFVPVIRADLHERPEHVFRFARAAAFGDGYCACRCGPCHHEIVLMPEPEGSFPSGARYFYCRECRRKCFKTNLTAREDVVVLALNKWMRQWEPAER